MSISFTEKQQQVIDARGCNLLVSAAAGSGKTAVLVERIVRMVSDGADPVDIDRLLVVTFTNAAAAEMRERISRALNDRLAADPENEHLQRQTTLLHNARITTIDSFCLFVLRNQFHTIGLDPGFRIAEEGEGKLIRQDALAEVLEAGYAAGEPEFLHCMEYFSAGSRDTAVEEIVLKLYDFAMSTPFPEQWLEERKQDYCVPWQQAAGMAADGREPVMFEELPWVQELMRQAGLLLSGCVGKLADAVRLCEEPDGPYMYGELLESEKEAVECLLRKCKEGSYDALSAAFGTIRFGRLSSKKDPAVSRMKREAAKGIRADVKEQLGDLQKKYFSRTKEQTLRQMEVCRRAVSALVDLTVAFKEMFEAKKRDRNLLDFDDIEHLALSILVRRDESGNCVPTETALEYRSHFHEILIDEYQDSNLVQEYILSCISGEDEGRYNRFMVGDVKQSIYKFRLARPELFLEKYIVYGKQSEPEMAAGQPVTAGRSERDPAQDAREMEAGRPGECGGCAGRDMPDRAAGRFGEYERNAGPGDPEMVTGRSGECERNAGQDEQGKAAELSGEDRAEFIDESAGLDGEEQRQWSVEQARARKIDLHQNFRSRGEVLNTTNMIFGQIMGQDVGGIVYDDLAALHPGAEYPVQPGGPEEEDPNATELLLFTEEEKAEESVMNSGEPQGEGDAADEYPAGGTGKKITAREQEAYGIAARIRELMRDFRVTDKESGTFRSLSYRDIVILLRTTSGWDEVFKRVLEEEGIPVYMTSRTGYFAAGEVQELLHFLRVLDNPLQDIPLYGVMHSYLGGFTEEEIAMIRAACPKGKYLYDAVKACVAQVSNELSDKICRFLECIRRYRELSVYLSVPELLQTILRETDYLNYVAVKPDGGKRRANVEMLLVKAADYEKTSYFGLYHFLRYMEQLEKYEVDYGEAGLQDENADVVRIMSIHKSKGLEFPVCFVSGLAKSFQTRETSGHLVLDLDAGIGVDYVDPDRRVRSRDLRRNVIAEKMKVDNLAEEMRILYVAMTRAREKLILTGTMKSPAKAAAALIPLWNKEELLLPYDVLLGRASFLELILAALARNRCMDDYYRACGLEPEQRNPFREQDMSIRVILSGWEETVEKKLEETVRMEERRRALLLSDASRDVDPRLMTRLSASFVYHYPYDNLRNLYTKTTVSELKMAGMREETDFSFQLYEEETVIPYLPGFLEKDERVSGSMRGSAFHKVMELFDFCELTNEVSEDKESAERILRRQVEEMRRSGRLSEDYYAAVSIPKIVHFLMSRAAVRMGEAARAGKLYKEQPFVLGLPANRLSMDFPEGETVLIQGIIDVFFEEEGRYVLLDYKTDAVKTAEELIKRYHVQLDYYAEALEHFSKCRNIEKILYSFKLGEEICL